jgi:DNA-binding transcriptional LysR family regulator
MINVKWLQAFRAVVQERSVTEASNKLNVTQPAVSRMIAYLEAELGFALFLRQKGRLSLTAQGEAFYDEIQAILQDLDSVGRIGEGIRKGGGVTLRIFSSASLVRDVIPIALKSFRAEHPAIQVALGIRGSYDILSLASTRRFDFGIVVGPAGHELGIPFGRCPALAVMAPGHRLAKKPAVTLQDLANEDLITVPANGVVRKWTEGKFAEIGKVLHSYVEVTSAVATGQLAASGLGVAITDPFAIHSMRDQPFVARPLDPHVEFGFSFITNVEHPLSPYAARLMALIREIVESDLSETLARIAETSDLHAC